MATILIIEDDRETARVLELSLKQEGYQLAIALDGLQGLELAQTQLPDLILLDLMLPGIDGFEICKRLRVNPETANVPVIVLSAKTRMADKQMAANLGVIVYLVKPYRRAELLAAVQAAITRKLA